MIARMMLAVLCTAVATIPASADFIVTGNPGADFPGMLQGQALGVGNYVRSGGGGVFSYNFYSHEFNLDNSNPLTRVATNPSPWTPGDRVVMMGGVMTPGVTAASLGWATGVSNTPLNIASQRVNAKFGVALTGPLPLGNNFTPSGVAPASGNGSGSFSGGFGGYGSVQVSIGAGNMVTANASNPATSFLNLLTPTTATGSNVAQFFGITSGPGYGAQGLNLVDPTNSFFDVARYAFTVDGSGNLVSWEVFLNTTLVQNYVSPFGPSAYGTVPTGGENWIQTVQNGGGAFSDSLVKTDVHSTPAPPAIFLAAGGFGLAFLRRFRR